ncbi:DUF2955 domain-containing protein [Azospirillum baldaniorum]|uniref:DUF2955 domain-containing protein n=1 Tax=Azospirillum baldaniorum TaxID=1064539 RepID=A0A9P1JZ24_9PROT|nr:DUF2955 domain-containing protein [Azospirillum baldaniorum]CCD02565.1 membrane protein of unknown function [Azospirillum baldaniorum]
MFRDPTSLERRNHGLRLASAVALGLVFEILRGALVPPLAAVIALQLLALPGPRPTAKMVLGLFLVISGASLFAYGVSALTVNQMLPYALGVGLIYLWGFALAARQKTAAVGTMTLTMGIVVTTMAAVSTDLAAVLVVQLSLSVGVRHRPGVPRPRRLPTARRRLPAHRRRKRGAPVGVTSRAMMATLIILPLHLVLVADGLAAMVVLLTVATMFRQVRIELAARYATSFAAGNLLGGLLAAAAVRVVSLHATIPVLTTTVVAASLLVAWWIERVPMFAHVLLPGFVAFTVLFGLAFMPASPSADVELLKRLAQIVAAGLYALGAVSLVMPIVPRSSAGGSVM